MCKITCFCSFHKWMSAPWSVLLKTSCKQTYKWWFLYKKQPSLTSAQQAPRIQDRERNIRQDTKAHIQPPDPMEEHLKFRQENPNKRYGTLDNCRQQNTMVSSKTRHTCPDHPMQVQSPEAHDVIHPNTQYIQLDTYIQDHTNSHTPIHTSRHDEAVRHQHMSPDAKTQHGHLDTELPHSRCTSRCNNILADFVWYLYMYMYTCMYKNIYFVERTSRKW